MQSNYRLIRASADQTNAILALVNQAYRGSIGWTRETDIVAGQRTTPEEIIALLNNPHAHLLVCVEAQQLIACVCIEVQQTHAYLGMLAVQPTLQGRGIGKIILQLAEEYVSETLGINKITMVVVSQRPELIAYYLRRGYFRTGKVEAYPEHLAVGVPKVAGLTIEYLEKTFN